jgi:acyl dehydratase
MRFATTPHATPALEAVAVGSQLPPLAMPITTTLIVAGAIASRDFYPGHHDQDAARRLGMRDVFMNILTSGGLVGRYASDWAGANGLIKNLTIRLGVPCYPGDVLRLGGQVTRIEDAGGTPIVTIDVQGTHDRGAHVSGQVRVALAGDAAARRDPPQPQQPATTAADTEVASDSLFDWLRAQVGQEPEPPIHARDPVNVPMIRAWCDAMSDHNPVYSHPDLAARSIHRGLVAPPTMIQAWFFPAVGTPRPAPGSRIGEIVRRLGAVGYSSVVATNFAHEYVRYVRPSDDLTLRWVIQDISEEKQTALGAGFFLTTLGTVVDQDDQAVCLITSRRLYFRPQALAMGANR